jgi:hypothetical protein
MDCPGEGGVNALARSRRSRRLLARMFFTVEFFYKKKFTKATCKVEMTSKYFILLFDGSGHLAKLMTRNLTSDANEEEVEIVHVHARISDAEARSAQGFPTAKVWCRS